MPEEIGIALIALLVILGLIGLLIAAASKVAGIAEETLSSAFARRRARILSKKKLQLQKFVQIDLPHQLGRAERMADELQARLEEARREPPLAAHRPEWQQIPFATHPFANQSAVWSEMDVQEIDLILSPNKESWLDKEVAILAQDCSYKAIAPSVRNVEFVEIPCLSTQLAEARFHAEGPSIKASRVAKFFGVERKQVEDYNRRREIVMTRCDELNTKIRAWNAESRDHWERFTDLNRALAEEELSKFRSHAEKYARDCSEQKSRISAIAEGFRRGSRAQVIQRAELILGSSNMPNSVPRSWKVDFDEDECILIVEIGLPNVVHLPPVKTVQQKTGWVKKPLNQTEKKVYIPNVHPAILLRYAYELFRNDDSKTIKLLVINGWVEYRDRGTGLDRRAYTASVMLERAQIESLNLRGIEPFAAFLRLKGKSAGRLLEIIPVEPTLSLSKSDSRFVDSKAILDTLDRATNLAAMDWQEFEHLIRELFEKVFAGRGVEVKITQASRDRGVDAIVFDPDPIHGGKYVIQAKRYTRTVDVSAVRDLCAVVRKEGASRGILVATSTYGADAYAFGNNEPITLLNGAELLGLLRKHGYDFRINLEEARRLQK